MRRGKKQARQLQRRLKDYDEMIKNVSKKEAYRRPGAHPGDYFQRYGG